MEDKNKALLAYMGLIDAGSRAAELSGIINKRVKNCMEMLNTFLNLNDKKHPAIVIPYQPANYKRKPPKEKESGGKN